MLGMVLEFVIVVAWHVVGVIGLMALGVSKCHSLVVPPKALVPGYFQFVWVCLSISSLRCVLGARRSKKGSAKRRSRRRRSSKKGGDDE